MKHMVEEAGKSDEFYIDSAGMGAWHIGQLPDQRMRRHGVLHGYHFDSRARQVSKSDFDRFDCIVAMDNDNFSQLSALASTPEQHSKIVRMADYLRNHPGQCSIPDPYYGGDTDFELVIELLEDACSSFLKETTHS